MPYCTQADLLLTMTADELVALADLNEDGTADAAVVTDAITRADSVIDSYLRKRGLDVPLATTPQSVRNASITLTVYLLRQGRNSINEDAQTAYKNIVDWLEDVSNGKATLGFDSDYSEAEPQVGTEHTTQERKFKREDLTKW